GIDTSKQGGVRVYPTATGLQPVLSFPVKNEQEFKKLLLNLWDLDIKTTPPPDAKLARQVPPSVKQKELKSKLEKNERLIFKLYDGFLRSEPGYVHFSTLVENIRLAKAALPVNLAEGYKIAAVVDGAAQPAAKRKQSFEAAKKELLAAIVKGEGEAAEVFAARKAVTEHQVAELERFFVEAERVFLGWNISSEKKEATVNIDLVGLPNTDLEKSVELLDTTPDEFAGVSKTDAVFSLSANFALDPLRKAFLKTSSVVDRAALKKIVADDKNAGAEVKAMEGDLIDLLFDLAEGASDLGVANTFVRSWKADDGSLSTVAGGRLPEGGKAKIEKLLTTLASRDPANKLEEKVETAGEIEIHKLTVPKLSQEVPEFVGQDGAVYVGLHEKTVWVAAGTNSLELLKKAIGEVAATGPKNGLVLDLTLKLGPYIDVLNNWYTRHPAAAPKKVETGKKSGAKKTAEPRKVEALISPEDLRKIAVDVFKQGKDTFSLTLGRQEKTAQVRIRLDEGLIRFAGTAASKFVKENLED
ncbi:MAG: hypothetical protein JSS02_15065, partial [Planctomycetes bacterium]|nr:hypothetical protein [Planctomycetota bacterium]